MSDVWLMPEGDGYTIFADVHNIVGIIETSIRMTWQKHTIEKIEKSISVPEMIFDVYLAGEQTFKRLTFRRYFVKSHPDHL